MQATILTLFPEMFPGTLGHSLAGKALASGLWSCDTIQIRDFAVDKHKTVDDKSYGGGVGLVMRPDVVGSAIEHALAKNPNATLIYTTPRGVPFSQELAYELVVGSSDLRTRSEPVGERASDQRWANNIKEAPPLKGDSVDEANSLCTRQGASTGQNIIILCGRYEGVDQRILDKYQPLEVSLGDYVLSGGEIAAQVMLDACIRLIPGVISSQEALDDESFSYFMPPVSPSDSSVGRVSGLALPAERDSCAHSKEGDNAQEAFTGVSNKLLEYPQYTQPANWQGLEVPDVLLSGNHKRIAAWRAEQALEITKKRRPDLLNSPLDSTNK